MSRGCQVRVKCLCTHEIHYYFIQLQDEGELVFVPSLQDTALTNQRDISPWSGVGLSGVEVRLTPLSRSLSLSLGPNAKERSDRNLPTIDRSVFVAAAAAALEHWCLSPLLRTPLSLSVALLGTCSPLAPATNTTTIIIVTCHNYSSIHCLVLSPAMSRAPHEPAGATITESHLVQSVLLPNERIEWYVRVYLSN